MTEPAEAEHDLLCHIYKALDEVPSCGCGWPDDARRLVWDILSLMPSYGAAKKARLAELIGPEASQQIVLTAIQRAGLINHGVSITSNWLEPLGTWVLWAVEQVGGIDGLHRKLDNAGYPHSWDKEAQAMEPCTDACWVVPDGWEPPPAPGVEPDPPEPTWEELLDGMNPIERGLAEDMMRADLDFTLYGNGPRPGDDGFQFGGLMAALGMESPTITAPYPKAPPPGPPRMRYNQTAKTWEAIR